MKLKEIQPGTKLELEIMNSIGNNPKITLVSEFEWAESDSEAVIAAPIHDGAVFPVHIGAHINIFFIYKEDLYKFSAKVLGRRAGDNIALLKIEVKSEFERIQRRQFFRFEYSVPFKYRVFDLSDDKLNAAPSAFRNTITRDLGGGGLCFLAEEEIDMNGIVEGELDLGGNEKVKFIGRVIRVKKRDLETRFKYEIGIEFYEIENRNREAIIKYIFQEQRKLRKKGLI